MKRFFILLTIAVFTFTGCTGSFKLTKAVNNFHRSQAEKWMDEVIFLGCVIIPVYWFAMAGDGIILNTVEFWTGNNPMSNMADSQGSKTVKDGNSTVVISYGQDADTLKLESNMSPENPLTFKRSDKGVVLMDSTGKVLYTSSKDANGGVSVLDKDMKLVKYFSPEEVSNKQL